MAPIYATDLLYNDIVGQSKLFFYMTFLVCFTHFKSLRRLRICLRSYTIARLQHLEALICHSSTSLLASVWCDEGTLSLRSCLICWQSAQSDKFIVWTIIADPDITRVYKCCHLAVTPLGKIVLTLWKILIFIRNKFKHQNSYCARESTFKKFVSYSTAQ